MVRWNEDRTEGGQRDHGHGHACFDLQIEEEPYLVECASDVQTRDLDAGGYGHEEDQAEKNPKECLLTSLNFGAAIRHERRLPFHLSAFAGARRSGLVHRVLHVRVPLPCLIKIAGVLCSTAMYDNKCHHAEGTSVRCGRIKSLSVSKNTDKSAIFA